MKKLYTIMLFLLCCWQGIAQNNRVIEGNARFTVLSPRMVRMEYDSTGKFVDNPSFVFTNRNVPAVAFTKSRKANWLVIKTDEMELRYKSGSGKFSAANLQITYTKDPVHLIHWQPGMVNSGNLKGTFRTLDGFRFS